jgi:hypothetical protein
MDGVEQLGRCLIFLYSGAIEEEEDKAGDDGDNDKYYKKGRI